MNLVRILDKEMASEECWYFRNIPWKYKQTTVDSLQCPVYSYCALINDMNLQHEMEKGVMPDHKTKSDQELAPQKNDATAIIEDR